MFVSCIRNLQFYFFFFFSSRRRHTRCSRDWSSDVCSSDLLRHRRAVIEPASGGFQQRGGEFVFAVRGQSFDGLDKLSFRDAEIVNQKLGGVGASEMVEALEVWLPIADVLIVKAVDDVFTQNQIRQIHVRPVVEQGRRNQVGLG